VEATREQMSLINKYLQSLSFGDIEYLHSFEREQEIIENLKNIINKDSHFLLGSKLFSHIVTQKMALYNRSRQLGYLFQQDFLELFKKLYNETREGGIEPWEAEVKTSKIIWNAIESDQISSLIKSILEYRDSRLTPAKDLEYIEVFNIPRNLINIVRSTLTLLRSPSSIYQESSNLVEKAIKLYEEKRYKETDILFELTLKNIQALEGNRSAITFAVLVGSLLISNNTTISKGIYFFHRAEKILETTDDMTNIESDLQDMAKGYWKMGLYKKSLDKLSLELYIHTNQHNELSIMHTEESLSSFYLNLHRFIEAQEWSLHFLNSAIRSSDEDLKIAYFLQANLRYAKTLCGLNSWNKALEHLNFSERTLHHLELSPEIQAAILLEISLIRGNIAVSKGQFPIAKRLFERGREELVNIKTTSPVFTRFLRAEAIFYRNQMRFDEGIKVLQPLFQEKDRINPENISLLAELLSLHSHENAAIKLLQQAESQLTSWNSIHGLSTIYFNKGYIFLLSGSFSEASKWFHHSLDIISSDLVNLKIFITSHLNLGYIELEKGNLVLAEQHLALADEKSSMSGSLAFILDSQFLKANLRIKQGLTEKGRIMIEKISQEAKDLEIKFIYDKTQRRLDQI
jgi:tetratricopeptide (TPR) repeat protein